MKSRILLILVLFPVVALAQQGDRKFITSELARSRNLPFSSGVLAGNTLYIAGTTADPDKIKAGLTPEAEVRDIMEQIKGTVEKAGLTMDDIVSMQVFTTDLDLYDGFNGVYRTYFKTNYPARAFVGGSKLLFGSRFEILAARGRSLSGRAHGACGEKARSAEETMLIHRRRGATTHAPGNPRAPFGLRRRGPISVLAAPRR